MSAPAGGTPPRLAADPSCRSGRASGQRDLSPVADEVLERDELVECDVGVHRHPVVAAASVADHVGEALEGRNDPRTSQVRSQPARYGGWTVAEAAATAVGANTLQLARYRCLQNGGSLEIVLEPLSRALPSPPSRPVPTDLPPFRTGLTNDDLDLTDYERSDLE